MGRPVMQKVSAEISVLLRGVENDGGIDDIDLETVEIDGREFKLSDLKGMTAYQLLENVALYATDPGEWERDDTEDP